MSPDVNLMIYAYDQGSPFHDAAGSWLTEVLNSDEDFGLAFQVILSFIRITTNQRALTNAFDVVEALSIVDTWLVRPNVRILSPGNRHWAIFRRLSLEHRVSGQDSTDVHLAALALEHGAVLFTADHWFARFPGLRWTNPLER